MSMTEEMKSRIEEAAASYRTWQARLDDILAEIKFGNLEDEELDNKCHRVRVLFGNVLSENYFLAGDVAILKGDKK